MTAVSPLITLDQDSLRCPAAVYEQLRDKGSPLRARGGRVRGLAIRGRGPGAARQDHVLLPQYGRAHAAPR